MQAGECGLIAKDANIEEVLAVANDMQDRNTQQAYLKLCYAAAEELEESDDPLGSDTDGSEEGSGSEEEDEGSDAEAQAELLKDSLQARQAARAAGDHPLQQNLREQAAELLAKYGLAPTKKKKKKKSNKEAAGNKSSSSRFVLGCVQLSCWPSTGWPLPSRRT